MEPAEPSGTAALTPTESTSASTAATSDAGRATRGATATRRGLFALAGAAVLSACEPDPGAGTSTTTAPPPSSASTSTTTTSSTASTSTTSTSTTSTSTSTTTTTAPPSGGGPGIEHVIDRLTFGIRPGLAAQIAQRGVSAWIDDQLTPATAGVADAESRLGAFTTLTNTDRQNADVQNSSGGAARLESELDVATILRAVHSDRQLYEVMCDFWTNHFNIWRHAGWTLFLKTRDNEQVIRPHALGRFADMLSASAHSPAMLSYLNNILSDASSAGGVNENYARELLELHTLGIIDGEKTYDEADVRGVAKLISGWSLNWSTGADRYSFEFHPWQHDRSAVSILDGAFSRPARAYGAGYDDGIALLDVLAHHPSTARYIAWKLCRRFVCDVPPPALVESTAAAFLAHDTQIAPTLRHIFDSPEFATERQTKVRRPLDHLLAILRGLGATVATSADGAAATAVRTALGGLGQPLLERPSPDGYPETAAAWVSSEGLINRWAVAGLITRNRLTKTTDTEQVTVDLTARLPTPSPSTCGELIASVARSVGNFEMPTADISEVCAAVGISPSDAASVITSRPANVSQMFGLVFCHPLHQRR